MPDGAVACTLMACFPNDGGNSQNATTAYDQCVKEHGGASFKSDDGCNTCSCMPDGAVACTLMACTSSKYGSTSIFDYENNGNGAFAVDLLKVCLFASSSALLLF
jgi:hypothetical protein